MAGASNPALEKIKQASFAGLIANLRRWSWVFFLVSLTLTSFPYFPPGLGGDFLVRPLSLYPLVALLALAVIPHLFTRPAPRTLLLVLPFVLVAAASALLSLLSGINSNFGVSVPQRVLRALITLLIGIAYYYTTALLPQSRQDLRHSLRWLYAGFALALLWGSLQAVYVARFSEVYFEWISGLQNLISNRHLFENRISGLTYEPNWFAEQISFLLMPWLFAAFTRNYTVFRWRFRRLTVETILLMWASLVLLFTFSRTGLMVLAAQIALALFLYRRPEQLSRSNTPPARRPRYWLRAAAGLGMLAIFIVTVGAKNTFFSRLWTYWIEQPAPSLNGYFDYIGFGPRILYSTTAYRIYEQHPLLGVGLGNYAFYFESNLPDRALTASPEILHLISQNATRYRLMTPKNLYIRLLAETGLLGLGAFLVFLVGIAGCVLFLLLGRDQDERFWGTAGVFGLLAFGLAAISYDSFTVPNMWIVFGIITAATWIFYQAGQTKYQTERSTPVVMAKTPDQSQEKQ